MLARWQHAGRIWTNIAAQIDCQQLDDVVITKCLTTCTASPLCKTRDHDHPSISISAHHMPGLFCPSKGAAGTETYDHSSSVPRLPFLPSLPFLPFLPSPLRSLGGGEGATKDAVCLGLCPQRGCCFRYVSFLVVCIQPCPLAGSGQNGGGQGWENKTRNMEEVGERDKERQDRKDSKDRAFLGDHTTLG